MKVTKQILLAMWGRLLKSIIQNDAEGKNSRTMKFFTHSILPYQFDNNPDRPVLTVFASTETINNFENAIGNLEGDNIYCQFCKIFMGWLRDEGGDGKLINLFYKYTDKLESEVEKNSFESIKNYMPQLINHVESQILGEEFYEEVTRKKAVAFDSLIARKSPSIYKQSNKLTRAKVGLTLTQKKTLNYLIWKYQNTDLFQTNLFGDVSISVSVKELRECGCGTNIKQILGSLKGLGKETWMEYKDESGKLVVASMFSRFEAYDGSKTVDVTFTQVMTSFINKLATYKEYTIIDRDTMSEVRSYATARMYELCSQFRYSDKYVFQITDEELRRIMNCESKYSNPIDFKRRVLQVAQVELETMFKEGHSDLYFEFSEKEKRSNENCQLNHKRKDVVSWIFIIKKNLNEFEYVENDGDEERKKYVTATLDQILACYVKSQDSITKMKDRIGKLTDKERFELTRELQYNIRQLSSKGELGLYEIICRYEANSRQKNK